MQKIKFLLLTFVIYGTCFGQKNFVVEYEYKNNIGYTCSSQLFFSDKESVFQINDKREAGFFDNGKIMGYVYNDKKSTFFYSNKQISYARIPLYGDEIIYSQSNKELKFVLTGKSKTIDKYNCNEASLNLNGRKYTIWFTPEINTSFGPLKINGLPGLIVELREETNNITISLRSIKILNDTKVFSEYEKAFLDKKPIDYFEYQKRLVKIMTAKKAKDIAYYAENGASMEYKADQSFFTQDIIDVPKSLVEELKKIN